MTNIKTTRPNFWINKYFSINGLITKDSISSLISNFWEEVMIPLNEEQYVLFILRVGYTNGNYASLSHIQKVNKNDLSEVLDNFIRISDIKSEDYFNLPVDQLLISYKLISDEKLKNKKSKITEIKPKIISPVTRLRGYNFPNTTDINQYGEIVKKDFNNYIIQKSNSSLMYDILINNDHNLVRVYRLNVFIIEFEDYFTNDFTSFTRVVNNQTFMYKNGLVIFKQVVKLVSYLSSITQDKRVLEKLVTLDIETMTIKNVMTPYCISFYDGTNKASFYLAEFKSPEDMIFIALTYIIKSKYHGYSVYVHNLSKFDGVFILNVLKSIPNTEFNIIRRNGKFISIKVIYKNKYIITFKDSLLMLPVSLSKLAKSFGLEDKGLFPYKFVDDRYNSNIDLNYNSEVPIKDYYENSLSQVDYDNMTWNLTSVKWSLKNETIKYCELDCILLYKILVKFNEFIFKYFNLNINKFSTLPSLAFAIFRCNFMPEDKIPLLSGNMFTDIRKSYTGGSVDVYKPHGQNLIGYDVNSLYPFIMKNLPMPVGEPIYFEGDIDILSSMSDKLGFFEVDITSPDDLKHPIIQTKLKTSAGYRTVSPLGNWTDWIFSEEMNNAKKFGYTFKIKRGYLFNKANIFNNYITTLYEIKKASHKDDPMYLISKLLMNSLYGRFGMEPIIETSLIINDDEVESLIDDNTITDIIKLNDNKSLINLYSDSDKDLLNFSALSKDNINISFASAITAYARIEMSKFKNNPEINLYYSDTDSIYVDKPLHPVFVGQEIGELKLENKFKEAVFLAPKVYAGQLEDDSEIVKVKGFTEKLSLEQIKSLLIKDSKLELYHDKWFRNFEDSSIEIKNQMYTLVSTENKRKLVYVENKLIDTTPFIINSDNKIINK